MATYFDKLSTLRTVLIQTIAFFHISHFLPIYRFDDLGGFINDLYVFLRGKENSNFNETRNLSRLIFEISEHIFDLLDRLKGDCPGRSHWNGIEFGSFFDSHSPFKRFKNFKDLQLTIDLFERTKDFVWTVFLSIYLLIGFISILLNQVFSI